MVAKTVNNTWSVRRSVTPNYPSDLHQRHGFNESQVTSSWSHDTLGSPPEIKSEVSVRSENSPFLEIRLLVVSSVGPVHVMFLELL